MSRERQRAPPRSWPVLTVFACIVGLQLLVTVISLDLMSAIRAYVTGESLYSKGQKDAQLHLIEYAEHHREEDYQSFLGELAVPIGYRHFREAMQKTAPDLDAAARGLRQGRSHEDDIPGGIRLFRWFHRTPLMAEAIVTWTEGDRLVEQIRASAEQAHARLQAGDDAALAVTSLRDRVAGLNHLLTPLTSRFATQLADGARFSQRLLLVLNLALASLLGLAGLVFVRNSARVQAATEDEVRRRRESLQRLLDSAAEGLYGVDTEGRCTFINRSALAMLGYAREADLLGRDIEGLIHRPPGGGGAESRIGRSYREPRELHIAGETLWRKDGSSFPVEFWSHPMWDDGVLQGSVATFFDITERLHMQAALRQGEVRMSGLVDAVNDGVITIDGDGKVVLFNRAAERLFGVPATEAIGDSVDRFIPRHPRLPEAARTQELQLGDAGGGEVRELFGRRADGLAVPLEVSLSRHETERGPLLTAVLRDVTGLQTARAERQAREALEASSRAKTEFLSRMSHELRTPLNAVIGFSQLLRLDTSEPPSLRQLARLQHIENAGAHLLALVNDVLDLSRVDSGQMTVTLEPVDLRASVEDALSMVLPLAASVGVKTWIAGLEGDLGSPSSGFADSAVHVRADRVRLRQVLVNLLSNAIKYNRSGGQVRVGWQVDADRCALVIADDGIGMTPEKLERLFEPFNRLGAERSKIEGTGIGLVLSRRLVELMRGELRIDSAPGRGTEAIVTLARSDEPPEQLGAGTPPSQHGALDESLRVLYAEDNEVNVEIVREVVKLRPSVALDVAQSGAQAFRKARRDQPQLILVDMNLGDMTGIELAQALHADPATSGIRLVALSADALPEQIDAALAMGFADYLTKPINFRELLDVLDGRRGR